MRNASTNISTQIAQQVREMIVRGELADGARINEVHLATELGVSRTPLREGLVQLVPERLIRVEPRRGFFVAPLTISEFEQIYDIRPLLDPEALRLTGIPPVPVLDRLDRINRRMLAATSAPAAIDLDDEWHMALLSTCPNRVLVELIQQVIRRTRCYEYALFIETKNVWTAGNEHEQITACLRKGDLSLACRLLEQNMRSGKAPIINWLTKRSIIRAVPAKP